MKEIQDLIHPLVQSQFPEFYQEEGPLFIEFVKAYYKWLETNNQQLYYSRNLLEYKDVDKTIDSFIVYFKEMFLKNMTITNQLNERLLVKKALNIYQNKGNEQGVELLIRSLFNEESRVHLPGDNLFQLSSGEWVKPIYLEVSPSSRNVTYKNKEILGSISGAKAFCEAVVKKNIFGKFLDVLYLSNVRGDFQYSEKIVEASNTSTKDAPTVVGSLTELTVINGGQDFSVGDEFDVVSSNGKNAKAIVTKISNETGRVDFNIIDGGWGFSNTALVYISDKVLKKSSLTNANNSITSFQRFETVTQNLYNIGFLSAVNSAFFVPNTVIFAEGNSTVSNATGGIVSVDLTSSTQGTLKVSKLTGDITSTNTIIKANLIDLVYDTSSNISLFANGLVIESINSTANANAYIISSTSSNSTHGSLLLRPISGNVYATNSSFRLVTNNATIGVVNTFSSNLYFTAVVANSLNVSASGFVIGENTNYIGIDSVLNTFYPNTLFSYIVGGTSNSYASFDFVSTGSGATFKVGSLDETETVLLNPDFLISNNTGNVPFMNINLDLSPDNANVPGGYGFVKFPGADLNTVLLDALRFNTYVIGSISSLTAINPGNDYNIEPFALVYEPDVAGYKRRDYVLYVSNTNGFFVPGERVEQTSNVSSLILTVDSFSGTSSNGNFNTDFVSQEFVYQSNGTANIASGFVYTTALAQSNGLGAGDVRLINITGTFQNTSLNGYQLQTVSTGATANITAVNTAAPIATSAYGEIELGSNSSVLFVRRTSFGSEMAIGKTVIGLTSGANAVIDFIYENANSLPIGENAEIEANVQSANSVVTELNLLDSGYGYLNKENVTLEKSGSFFTILAQTKLLKQGIGQGYYRSSGGFLSNDKKLIDSDYYQEYSYEVQTKIPFSKYKEILTNLCHVAGTKMFGKVIINSFVDVNVSSSRSTQRLNNLQISNSTIGSSFTNSEFVVFSNGTANSLINQINTSSIATGIVNYSNVIIIEVPDSNNSFAVGRLVYSPNANSYSVSGNVLAKSSNSTTNTTLLYVTNVTGTFTSSNTISGHISSNTSNNDTIGDILNVALEVYGYGNVYAPTLTTLTIPVSNTRSTTLTGTANISSNSVVVLGTSTTFNSDFSNNQWIEFTSGASTDVRQIKTVTNATHMILRSYPLFSNTTSTFKKLYPFISNTSIKTSNASSNVAVGNVFSFTANSSFFKYYVNNVYGSFNSSNTVEGYINTSTTNTYSVTSAINTLVVANTENDIPINSVITGKSSNTSAVISYNTVRYENNG